MSAADRQRWDEHYRHRSDYPDPDPLLLLYTPSADDQAHALDLAGGMGQNALWLAEQGYTVDLMDISRVALVRAQRQMAARGLRRVNMFQVDFDQVQLNPDTYDLVCVFRYWNRWLLPQIRAAVKPGGRIIYETFNSGYLALRPDFNPEYLLESGELLGSFGDWRVIHHDELSTTSQVVAVKPDATAAG